MGGSLKAHNLGLSGADVTGAELVLTLPRPGPAKASRDALRPERMDP